MSDALSSSERAELNSYREKIALIRALVRSLDRGVGYRNPLDHDTYGEYVEGKSDFAGQIEELLDGTNRVEVTTEFVADAEEAK